MAVVPKQKPGLSRQDYRTPKEFLTALKDYLGIRDFTIDLAADAENRVTERFYSLDDNSLLQTWVIPGGYAFCNPPFSAIGPWVRKAAEESRKGAKIAMLIPASVGSNWWRDHVHNQASVLFLNGRISFDGIGPFPKDCCILLYPALDQQIPNYNIWSWKSR